MKLHISITRVVCVILIKQVVGREIPFMVQLAFLGYFDETNCTGGKLCRVQIRKQRQYAENFAQIFKFHGNILSELFIIRPRF